MALHKVATTGDFPPGSARAIEVAGRSVALFNVEGTIHAIDNDCTHDGGPLSEGVVSDGCVVCPWHGAEFDLGTGKAALRPRWKMSVATASSYLVRYLHRRSSRARNPAHLSSRSIGFKLDLEATIFETNPCSELACSLG